MEAAPEATPYTFLKSRILETHQLSDYEKFDMLVKMEPMGCRKPSQLLAAMMEFCPAGKEKTLPFHYYFTQQLPPALRTQLGKVEHGDLRALAARADKLWKMNVPPASTVAAVEMVDGGGGHLGNGNRVRGGVQRGRGSRRPPAAHQAGTGQSAGSSVPATDPTPSSLAQMSSGLCFFHWNYAEKAQKCEAPCTWGN